ncbi:MAG: tetratricopeptide repeat protein [Gemmatimonadales bacterium]
MRPWFLLALAAGPLATRLVAQDAPGTITASALVARGDSARNRFELKAALTAYDAALARDSMDYAANWKAALTLVDIGKETPDSVRDPARDRLYERAEELSRRAVAIDPRRAEALFVLSNAVGRAALTKSPKERVKSANEIYDFSTAALGIDHRHDGAYHVLGRWNAEIMRLSSVERFFAKSFMGGKRFSVASWDEAQKYLERAVELNPTFIYHRLDLAEVYIDRHKYAEARVQLEKIPSLPRQDASDPTYVRDAHALLEQIKGK